MKIVCTHCVQKYEADAEYIGQTIHCQSCGNDFVAIESEPVQIKRFVAKVQYDGYGYLLISLDLD